MARAGVALGFVVAASLFAPAVFGAPDAGVVGPNPDALVVELDQQIAALSTGDCVLACQSLGAMRRTVDRICALDPGARCDKARDKVQDVARKVAAACPTCPDAPSVVVAKPTGAPPEAPPPAADQEVAARKGGCAACSVGVNDDAGLGLIAAVVALAALGRRRRGGRR